jgi:single-strand DNA-binding protein
MASVNKVILIGNLGADPEVRATGGGQSVANFRIATSEQWQDKSGEKKERTEWHSIVVWGKLAELCGKYLKKGRPVYIEGKLQTREWEKDGVKRYSTEVIAHTVTFLGSKEGASESRETPPGEQGSFGSDDEIPF